MKHIDIAPHLFGCADQGGMAAYGIGALTNQRRLGIGFGRQRRPNQAAAPVIDHVTPGIARKALAEHPARGRRTDDPPHRPGAERPVGREWFDVANGTPDRPRSAASPHPPPPPRLHPSATPPPPIAAPSP